MEEIQQTAAAYYNNNKKRSFFFSRVVIIVSMVVLVIALGVNVVALYSNDTSTVKSHASAPESQTQKALLPSLPAGCVYKQAQKGFAVFCPTPTPAQITSPVHVSLPNLPAQCTLETSTNGTSIRCTSPHDPIPTAPVTLPTNCITTNQTNKVVCTDNQNQSAIYPLPSLPEGCSYALEAKQLFVVCPVK